MKSDIINFISNVKKNELNELGQLIMSDKIDETLDLCCELITRHFHFIPKSSCIHYGEYILYLTREAVRQYYLNTRN